MAAVKRAPDRRLPLVPAANLHLPLNEAVDYVIGFQDLARLGLELCRNGPSLPLLLRKAVLELRVGHYDAARLAAGDALACNARCAEAHWLNALSLLGHCLVDLGLLTEGPGEAVREPDVPVLDRLAAAQASLLECIRLSAGEDQEAASLHAYLQAVLSARPSRGRLPELLRCLA